MSRPPSRRRFLATLALLAALPARAEDATGRQVLERVENLLWARTLQGRYEMSIVTPRWQRTLALRVWMDRPRRTFIRIDAPAKEAGIGSLRIGSEMWNYLPAVERTIKIPPSMMLQPWMGSDFTNDDLVKESSILDDYTHEIGDAPAIDGQPAHRVVATPKPEAAVVWGRVVYFVRKSDAIPLKQEYFDERGELVRVMTFSDIREVGGRRLPTRWEMRPVGKPGHMTTVVLQDAVFNPPLDDEVFTQRHLQRR
jgi:outer membrane lipoprotein-sorting protein